MSKADLKAALEVSEKRSEVYEKRAQALEAELAAVKTQLAALAAGAAVPAPGGAQPAPGGGAPAAAGAAGPAPVPRAELRPHKSEMLLRPAEGTSEWALLLELAGKARQATAAIERAGRSPDKFEDWLPYLDPKTAAIMGHMASMPASRAAVVREIAHTWGVRDVRGVLAAAPLPGTASLLPGHLGAMAAIAALDPDAVSSGELFRLVKDRLLASGSAGERLVMDAKNSWEGLMTAAAAMAQYSGSLSLSRPFRELGDRATVAAAEAAAPPVAAVASAPREEPRASTGGRSPRRPGSPERLPRCFKCQRLGHIARYCRNQRAPSPGDRSRSPGPRSDGNERRAPCSVLEELVNKTWQGVLETEVRVEGRTVKALLDTGAAVSLMTVAQLRDLQKGSERMEHTREQIRGVDGSTITPRGAQRFYVEFGSVRRLVRFLVVERAPCGMLLGMDVLGNLRASIMLGEGELRVSGQRISVNWRRPEGSEREVRAARNVQLAPRALTLVPLEGKFLGREIVIERSPAAEEELEKVGVFVPKEAVYHVHKGKVCAAVLNTGNDQLLLRAGQPIGVSRAWDNARPVGTLTPGGQQSASPGSVQKEALEEKGVISEADIEERVAKMGHLSDRQRQEVRALLRQFRPWLVTDLAEGGKSKLEPLDIKTTDDTPVNHRGRRFSPAELEIAHREVEKTDAAGVTEQSRSAWNAPILIIPKKDGTMRFCVDFRRLNVKAVVEHYPMPRIDEMLEQLGKARWFSTLDAASGYHQVPLTPESREKTAFSVPGVGHRQFVGVPLGWVNAPAHFQRCMELALRGLTWEVCLVYIDDILIYTETFEQHVEALSAVLGRLREVNLKLKWKKCKLFQTEVTFLGHVVGPDGIRPDPEKTRAIAGMKRPRNGSEVRRFLGLVNHFRTFIPSMGLVAAPLYDLTSKSTKWSWGEAEEAAFQRLKDALVKEPILAHPDMSKPFIIQADGAGGLAREWTAENGMKKAAVGGALLQQKDGREVVVAYASQALRPRVGGWHATELELTAAHILVKRWRHFVHGRKFLLRTDHQPLQGLLGDKAATHPFEEPGSRVTALVLKLAMYLPGMKVEWVPGKKNAVADALSRPPVVAAAALAPAVAAAGEGPAADTQQRWQDQVAARAPEMKYVAVPGDGNCLFHAIGKAVGKPGEEVRAAVVDQLKQSPLIELWAEQLGLDMTGDGRKKALRTVKAEAAKYGRSGVYGDHRCVVAASKAFSARIHVVAPEPRLDVVVEWDDYRPAPAKKEREIWLAWNGRVDEGGHFDALLHDEAQETERRQELAKAQREDSDLCEVIFYLENKIVPKDGARAEGVVRQASHMGLEDDGVLYNYWMAAAGDAVTCKQLAVPAGEWRRKLIEQYHGKFLGGHTGAEKMLLMLRARYWWPSMSADVKQFVRTCHVCQERATPTQRYGLLKPIEPGGKWEHVFIDFVQDMPESAEGYRHALVMVDGCSKEVRTWPTKEVSAEAAVEGIVRRVLLRGDYPRIISSDQASAFKSELMRMLTERCGMAHVLSTPYHPQSHGQVERMIREVRRLLSVYISAHQRDWPAYLDHVEYRLLVTPSATTGYSPFFILRGYEPLLPVDQELAGTYAMQEMRAYFSPEDKAALARRLEAWAAIGADVKKNILERQSHQKEQFDKTHKPADAALGMGKRVMLEVETLAYPGASPKLARPWKGPYVVVQERGDLNRLIQHEKNKEDVQEVHIQRLKPYLSPGDGVTRDVEEVLQERLLEGGVLEYLVRLDGSSARGDRWIPAVEAERRAEPAVIERFRARPQAERREPLGKARAVADAGRPTKTALKKLAAEEKRRKQEEERRKAEEDARREADRKAEEARKAREVARAKEELERRKEEERAKLEKAKAKVQRGERAARRAPLVSPSPPLRSKKAKVKAKRRVSWSDGEVELATWVASCTGSCKIW